MLRRYRMHAVILSRTSGSALLRTYYQGLRLAILHIMGEHASAQSQPHLRAIEEEMSRVESSRGRRPVDCGFQIKQRLVSLLLAKSVSQTQPI